MWKLCDDILNCSARTGRLFSQSFCFSTIGANADHSQEMLRQLKSMLRGHGILDRFQLR
jgi:hypothetical protein